MKVIRSDTYIKSKMEVQALLFKKRRPEEYSNLAVPVDEDWDQLNRHYERLTDNGFKLSNNWYEEKGYYVFPVVNVCKGQKLITKVQDKDTKVRYIIK